MKSLLAAIFGNRPSGGAFGVKSAGVQPGLWSPESPAVSPTTPAAAPTPTSDAAKAGHNPFAAAPETSSVRKPLFAARSTLPGPGLWARMQGWLGLRNGAVAGRRLFSTNDQLELVLGRPQQPARNRNLEIGLPARVRRSDATVGKSKVIYESKPASGADATRMMEESDRAYSRLRGRRLESMRVAND